MYIYSKSTVPITLPAQRMSSYPANLIGSYTGLREISSPFPICLTYESPFKMKIPISPSKIEGDFLLIEHRYQRI